MDRNPKLVWFTRVMWAGIAANFVVGLFSLAQPQAVLDLLNLPPASPLVWPRFAAFLLLLLSILYMPSAIDPIRHRFTAWASVGARFGGVVFFGIIGGNYIPFGLFDFVFGLPQLILLVLGLREIGELPKTAFTMPRLRTWTVVLAVLIVLAIPVGLLANEKLFRRMIPVYSTDVDQFKYGSIGNDDENGLPYLIWRVLPDVFPDHLPGYPNHVSGSNGYAALGFVWEPGRDHTDTPVGFSRARIGFDRMSINCAFCHASVVQTSPGAQPVIYPGGPANTVDVFGYQRFLTESARDPRFTADVLMPAIEQVASLSFVDRLLYRYLIIPATRSALLRQGDQFAWTSKRPEWGPGRIDPFNPVKFGMLGLPDDGTIGNSVMLPAWGLDDRNAIRANAPLHWDGLQTSIHEVIVSSALGDGATAKGYNFPFMDRVERYLRTSTAPVSPFNPDRALVQRGQTVFTSTCAECHGRQGARTLTVIPLSEIGTDRHRVDMWTTKAKDTYNNYRTGYDWGFKSFQKVEGYITEPLNAVWLRGPYLHNGSVPSIADLLKPAAERPASFARGSILVDREKIGFVTNPCTPGKKTNPGFCFDTHLEGNSNAGHLYGTTLPQADKDALLAYLLTL